MPQLKLADFDPFSGPEILRVIPQTASQTEIWLSCALGGEHATNAYNESNSLRLSGELKVPAFEKAITTLVERHESLRSSFSADGKNMVVYKNLPNQFTYKDLSAHSVTKKNEILQDHLLSDALHLFNLVKGPLFKATLLKLNEEEYHFTFTAHHLIIDGWSIGLILEEMGKLYTAYAQDLTPDLPPPKSFSDFAQEQNLFLESPEYREIENFWLKLFKDKVPVLNLPTDRPRPFTRTYKSSRIDHELDRSLVTSLKNLGIKAGCTFVNTLMAAFEVLLYRHTGQEEIIIGLPASGQAFTGNYHLVGHCVNLLPLRSQPQGKINFIEYLSLRKSAIYDAYENQKLTFGSLLKKLKVARDPSRIPLVPVVFNVDFGMEEGVGFHNLKFKLISNPKEYLNFELFLNVNGSEDSVMLEWTYNSHLFKAETIVGMIQDFDHLLKSVISNPAQSIDTIEMPGHKRLEHTPNQEVEILNPLFTKFQPVHSLIEQSVLKFSERTAVIFRDKKCSYRELNENSNRLANFLIQKGLVPGNIVGIVMDRSIDMIVAALAALKAGCAYLPIDTDYPNSRIEYMLSDSSKVHVIHKDYQKKFNSQSAEIVWEDFELEQGQYPANNPELSISPDDIAYLIYTSGSTGRPKGVVLEHQNLFNFLVGVSAVPGISQEDRVLAVSSFSFDIAIQELLLPLVHGAQCFILDKYQRKDPKEILQVIDSQKITHMFATPAHWKMMLDSDWEKPFPDFNIICGGEHLTNQLAASLFSRGKSLWNIYGPTETTVFSTAKKIKSPDELITIGKPIYNTKVYILDENLDPVGTGLEGEIFISGKGVSRGYLDRPELTAEKFLKDPFQPGGNRRMYRTGDLGKFLPNGEIMIMGRKDLQVKLRGHRIELGEIEHALIQLDEIKDAIVMLREDFPGNPRLTAYVILTDDRQMTKGEKETGNSEENANKTVLERPKGWKRQLTLSLPSFMVPTDFVVMEKFPITSNGKTDRKAFPQPDFDAIEENVEKLLPETPEEELVARIWGDALGFKEINITDNFFEIGGHSLIAVQVMTHLEKESGIKLPLSILFEYPTIKKLAWLIKSKGKNQPWKSLVPIKPSGTKDPLYIVHGGGLNVLPFYAIAKQLDAEQPLYGIQAYGLNGKDEPHFTVEAMAAHYVDEILSQNPKGPYALAGYSFGGIIAYEMAKQLKKQGKHIKSLIMFDTYAIRSDHRDGFLKKMTNRFLTEIGKRLFDLELMIKDPAILKRVKKNSLHKKLNKIKKRLPVKQQVRETEIMEIIKNIRKVHKEAGKNYIITPYDGDIHLFRAKTRTSYLKDFKYFGWKPFVNKINIIEMEGEHTTMFSPPHEKNFVKILQEILNNADKKP